MPITETDRKYLKHKHVGGKNNDKGNKYESFYATYRIALLISAKFDKLETVNLSAHVPNAFVDDYLEEVESFKQYHQLKDVKNLSWKYEKVKYDFTKQIEISNENNELFGLKLVNSNEKLIEIPEDISEYTSVEYFPAYHELTHSYLEYPEFKKAIENIAIEGRKNDDELIAIATTILGVWHSIETPKSLKEIVELIKKTNRYDSLRIYPSLELSNACKEILNNLKVEFYINGEILYWSYKYFSGKIVWSTEREELLLKSSPTKIEELFTILS